MIIWIRREQICINFTFSVASRQISVLTQPRRAARQPAQHRVTFGNSQRSVCLRCTMHTVWHALVDRQTHTHTHTPSQQTYKHTHTLVHKQTCRHCYPRSFPHYLNTHCLILSLSLTHTHTHTQTQSQWAAFAETQRSSPQRIDINARHYGWTCRFRSS